jgi:hypothetical protein
MNSRRGFLKAGLILGGASLVGGGLYYKQLMHSRARAEQLVYFLDYPDLAGVVGRDLLESDQALQPVSLEQMTGMVLQRINLSEAQLPGMTHSELLQRLQQQVHSDFVNEQIVLTNGWLLSRTEAYLCALQATLS